MLIELVFVSIHAEAVLGEIAKIGFLGAWAGALEVQRCPFELQRCWRLSTSIR